ncbi:DUF3108 domain-containing protein [Aquabacterium sp.]|uniref:DUF3108 domain-containing protein n=1 Tax=Aquabacterium sp. TaxID=1872578 RepID=UPI002D7EFD84|nr:DUF3108 domain-containing protein [Aquabacterium sp.]
MLRRRSGWMLLAGVTLVHVLAMDELVTDRFGWGASEHSSPRIEVAFVRELVQRAAPAAAAVPRPARAAERVLPSVAKKPATPASAPDTQVAVAPAPPPEPVPSPPTPQPAAAEPSPASTPAITPTIEPPPPEPTPRVAEAPSAAASTAETHAFEWPPSTRLSYALSGYYRGPIEGGHAQVEWLRAGTRYQVRMESSLGPMFSRRVSSEGELTDRGLVPSRFEGEQKQLFRAPKRWTQDIGRERIAFADGVEIDSLPGVQDEASQFVQLTWLFTTQPALLQVGRSIEVPMVINRRADRWIYDVKSEETLYLPFGQVPTFHVKPRREAKGGEMVVEIWFAPTLQYLPVRMLVRQSESTYMELTLKQPPLQAAK